MIPPPQNLTDSPQKFHSSSTTLQIETKPTKITQNDPKAWGFYLPTVKNPTKWGCGAPLASRLPPPHSSGNLQIGLKRSKNGVGAEGGTPLRCPGGPEIALNYPKIHVAPPGPGFLFLRERRCLRFCFSPVGPPKKNPKKFKKTAKEKKQKAPVAAHRWRTGFESPRRLLLAGACHDRRGYITIGGVISR